ncbi:MAG: cytochrome c [Thioalkalivibrio sp.]
MKVRHAFCFIPFALALLFASPLHADPKRGESLHASNCVSCHVSMVGGNGSLLYTRADRTVGSRDQLIAQVNRCESTLGLRWFEEDVTAVVEYLNSNYYKF